MRGLQERNFAQMRGKVFACIIKVRCMYCRLDQNSSSGTDLAYEVLGCTNGKSKVDFANVRGRAACTFERLFSVEERMTVGQK